MSDLRCKRCTQTDLVGGSDSKASAPFAAAVAKEPTAAAGLHAAAKAVGADAPSSLWLIGALHKGPPQETLIGAVELAAPEGIIKDCRRLCGRRAQREPIASNARRAVETP